MPQEPNAEPAEDERPEADALSLLPRTIALLVGIASLITGGLSVFVTTNQAGSVALLGVGLIFVTVAVNGTPLLGAKFKDYELTMAPRRSGVVKLTRMEVPQAEDRRLAQIPKLDPPPSEEEVEAAILELAARGDLDHLLKGDSLSLFRSAFCLPDL